ncbi:MAG: nucleotidyltransferase family protein [Deltaproteobacteria bacterium]|nr:nucleotidyltransferase family protein [Deltaproteobacteria bacterium]MBI2540475.1 nucleotidyltransferase family protein [Deltaproteobacteria bacterium]
MIVAVVLSAGESSRMGSPKALLPISGIPFIEEIVRALKGTKVDDIIIVVGHHAAEIQGQIAHLPITVVVNEDYKRGQLSSLVAAIRSLQSRTDSKKVDGLLVHLVDHPFISPPLVDEMIERFYQSKKLIVVPRYRGRRGHPVLFSRALFSELLSTPVDQGAKAVVHAHWDDTLEIETEYEGVTIDIDTPEEYRRYLEVR